MENFKKVSASRITLSQLMLPSHSNFSGKIHGGYILSLMDQIAFACASKYSGKYCVTASVDTVDFLNPIEVGELVTLKSSVNYVGRTSMVVGIRVTSQNIQTGKIKHCNSSYFTMVAKDGNGKSSPVPGLILSNLEEVRRFYDALRRISSKKEHQAIERTFDFSSDEALKNLQLFNVKLKI
ncbi:Acyl-CoA hydrolase family protein [Flavobacterium limnosediminis JC2902]|uniref:Acyl-CoA hydrolase family protein n=1 Tax=Flavobacterium limnosediminis JC2902 TaxID=1341181 RepID=V6SL58_9FLAO|nr:acyl-CoA thioesterase [Flavobacterium limnosediminis]ESU27002.1 Acyl-CoA hydrolase family protein [Flavobacterium limnosediminis JC2902]